MNKIILIGNLTKTIKGYTKYGITNKGEIFRINTMRILKQKIDRFGYKVICLCENNIKKTHRIHKLLALTFIPNYSNYPIINHKDGNKLNNSLENLEWCTYSYNVKHGFLNNKRVPISGKNHYMHGKKLNLHHISKPIIAYNLDKTIFKTYSCAVEAELDNFSKTHISQVCKGKRKTTGNKIWEYA